MILCLKSFFGETSTFDISFLSNDVIIGIISSLISSAIIRFYLFLTAHYNRQMWTSLSNFGTEVVQKMLVRHLKHYIFVGLCYVIRGNQCIRLIWFSLHKYQNIAKMLLFTPFLSIDCFPLIFRQMRKSKTDKSLWASKDHIFDLVSWNHDGNSITKCYIFSAMIWAWKNRKYTVTERIALGSVVFNVQNGIWFNLFTDRLNRLE